jgi:hypothetical protein
MEISLKNPHDKPRKALYQLRIAPELADRVAEVGSQTGRTTTAACVFLIERGLDLQAMLARNDSNASLLFELFAEVRNDRDAASVLAVLANRYGVAALADALAKLKDAKS